MNGWTEEFWVVLCHSTRTQLAIAFGVFLFVGIPMLGQVLVGGLELHGLFAPLTDMVQGKLMHRYDKAAWAALGGFALLAVKTFRNDRRRLLGV